MRPEIGRCALTDPTFDFPPCLSSPAPPSLSSRKGPSATLDDPARRLRFPSTGFHRQATPATPHKPPSPGRTLPPNPARLNISPDSFPVRPSTTSRPRPLSAIGPAATLWFTPPCCAIADRCAHPTPSPRSPHATKPFTRPSDLPGATLSPIGPSIHLPRSPYAEPSTPPRHIALPGSLIPIGISA